MPNPEHPAAAFQPHADRAVLITPAEAEHFEHQTLSSDVFIGKDQRRGFTAQHIEVDGNYPKTAILPGNTCTYFVLEGEGEFTLNNQPMPVAAGDFVMIPPHNIYHYAGKMKLIEVKISPSNGFGQKLLREQQPEQAVNENDASQAARPHRKELATAIGELLSRGHTLTAYDITYMLPYYNYRPVKSSTSLINYGFGILMRQLGYDIDDRKFHGRLIFFDPRIPLEETDIAASEAEIIKRLRDTVEARK